MANADQDAAALKQAALKMAIEYHSGAALHRESRGAARPRTITATADEFFAWLRDVATEAGVDPDKQNPRQGEP